LSELTDEEPKVDLRSVKKYTRC